MFLFKLQFVGVSGTNLNEKRFDSNLEFNLKTSKDVIMKFDVIESKIKSAFIQIARTNKDRNENLDEIEDKQEYLENHSRRNNVKLLGVPEDDDDTEMTQIMG